VRPRHTPDNTIAYPIIPLPIPTHNALDTFKAALKVVVAEEQSLAAVWPNEVLRPFKTACTLILLR
jgi:hypothetical protein